MSKTILDKSLYRFDEREHSYCEATVSRPVEETLQHSVTIEVAIIGGGFSGCSAALHLARDHGISNTVLDAGRVGWGASGKNGRFVNIPASKLSAKQLIRRFGLEETKYFFATSVEATKKPGRRGGF